jgi:hypothetical protein
MTRAQGSRFEPVLRRRLAHIADCLIPPVDGMPAPSAVGVAGRQLDLVLASRPDLAGDLHRALEQAAGVTQPLEWIERLAREDPAGHEALATAIVAGYYLHPEVMRRLGYPGQIPEPVRPDVLPDYVEEGLLERVYERGPIYRPTPET